MSQEQTVTGLEELERVREILFGSVARDQDKRIQQLQAEIVRLQQSLSQTNAQLAEQHRQHVEQVEDLRKYVDENNRSFRSEMEMSINQLNEDKLNRSTLGDLLIALGSRLKESSTS